MKRQFLPAVLAIFFVCFAATEVLSVPLAFPGAEGSGRFATGGRGGDVYEVTNLNNSGAGSIVDAISSGNRTIVFRVSGTIALGDEILRPKSNTTIAGQTAPGDGICIKGRIYIGDVSDVVIRYIRVRVDEGAANSSGDAIDIDQGQNIVIDHVSASYARDETISCQDGSDNVTVQWCILSEALTFEGHSYGSLIRGEYGESKTYHHNLYAHNNGRNPRPGNYTSTSSDPEGIHFDFRNNVVYNWDGGHPGYNADSSSTSRYNFVGNVSIAGPESSVGYKAFKENSVDSYAYWSGNAYGANYYSIFIPADQWSLVTFNGFSTSEIIAYQARSYEIPMEPVITTSAFQALDDVLNEAGANFPVRDVIDTRIVNDVINGTGGSIATTDEQPEGAWPALSSMPAPADSDHDGMPDDWETEQGLDPGNAADRNYYDLDTDYTNLEVYLDVILEGDTEAPSAPDGLAITAGEGTVSLNWNDNSESDLAGYNIYRSETSGSGYIQLNGDLLTSSDYTDNAVNNGTTYFYVVTAVDTSFNESDYSAQRHATPIDITAPAVPVGLWATISEGKVYIDWLDNSEADFDVYNVYRLDPGSGYVLLTDPGIGVSNYTDETVISGNTYYYIVTAEDIYGNESDASVEISATLSDTAMGTILREWWSGVEGSTVSSLTLGGDYPDNPSGRDQLANLEGPTNWADSYGTRIRGYVHPPTSGDYTFYIASDNNSELWLSTDGTPANVSLIAEVPDSTNPRQWDKYAEQQSTAISLIGGSKYYIEVLHKDDNTGDHLAVAWSGPGIDLQVIEGQYLSPLFIGIYGDTNDNIWVDIEDLSDFIPEWMESDCAESSAWDINGDCVVDLYEFSILAGNWLRDFVESAAPTNLVAVAGDGFVSLDWDDNTEEDQAGYNLYRSTTSGADYELVNTELVETSDYTDDSVVNGTTYYYIVTAIDLSSNESDPSNEDWAIPNPPSTSITLQEDETGFCSVDGDIESEHAGYTGTGYANTDNASGNGINYRVEVLTAGTYSFVFRFATTTSRPAELIIDSEIEAPEISFPSTGAWTTWSTTAEVEVVLTKGVKDIRLQATGTSGLANIDYMQISGLNIIAADCP